MSEIDFKAVFDSMPDAVAVCDEEGTILALNAQARSFLGAQPGAQLNLRLTDRETVRQMRLTHPSSGQEFYLADVRLEGATREHVSVSLHPLGGIGYRVVFAPVGSRVVSSPNVRILESLVNVGRHLTLFKTVDKMLALFAASFADVFPEYAFRIVYEGGEQWVHEHVPWDDHVMQPVGTEFELPHVPFENLIWSDSKRGYRLELLDHTEPRGYMQVEKREDRRFAVKEREAFETFVQQAMLAMARFHPAQRFRAVEPIIDQLDAVVIICDARRNILVTNKTFDALIGGLDAMGRDLLEYFEEAAHADLRTSAAAIMAGGASEPFEGVLRMPGDDRHVTLRIVVSPSGSRDSETTQGFIVTGQHSDVNLVELEERLTQAEHLMNLGQLATGVAHELKNPLTSILNYADYLLQKYQNTLFEDRDSERLQRIIEGVERIDAFVHDLVLLARPDATSAEMVSISRCVKESALMCDLPMQRYNARLELDLDENDALVRGSGSQLKQVFVNLVTNAAKAMPDTGGVVRVETSVEGDEVECRVIDDAEGMSDETLARIFEPFFTTGDGDGGTGLGLAIVRSIVDRHSGRIHVDSEPGTGTTFTITFPIAESP